jgi:hypothetical protein
MFSVMHMLFGFADINTAVDAMLRLLCKQHFKGSLLQKLVLIRQTLTDQILPAWKELQLGEGTVGISTVDGENFPLGFSTGGAHPLPIVGSPTFHINIQG